MLELVTIGMLFVMFISILIGVIDRFLLRLWLAIFCVTSSPGSTTITQQEKSFNMLQQLERIRMRAE